MLLTTAFLYGGNAALAGLENFAGSVTGISARASDDPAGETPGIARLPLFNFAPASVYPPSVLYPVQTHAFPDWLLQKPAPVAVAAPVVHPVIAICIDDLGEDLAGTDRAMALPQAVAMAFLPYAEATPFLAVEAEHKGHDVLAHVPMQAVSNTNPGPNTLMVGAADNGAKLAWALARVPGLIGINNHEGSKFTADAASLEPIDALLAARHLLFFDSRTGPDSKVVQTARAAGVTSASRDVFLDDVQTPEAVKAQLDDLVAQARRSGVAIAIGHPHDVTLTVLAAWLKQDHGVTLVPLTEAIARKSGAMATASR